MMEPLRVEATLRGPIASRGIMLDGLLAWAVAARDHLPPPASAAECAPIQIPLQLEPGGRFHMCSQSFAEEEQAEHRWTNQRFPVAEAQAMGWARLRRIGITSGACKSYRIPRKLYHNVGDTMTWWCIGDGEQVISLLSLVSFLGKKRAVGAGKVVRWSVERCETWDGFPVARDRLPLRPLPADYSGLRNPRMAYARVTFPYWDRVNEELCAVPS